MTSVEQLHATCYGANAESRGRLVVKHTFLDFIESDSDQDQPMVSQRSHTDSELWKGSRVSGVEVYCPGSSTEVTPEASDDEGEPQGPVALDLPSADVLVASASMRFSSVGEAVSDELPSLAASAPAPASCQAPILQEGKDEDADDHLEAKCPSRLELGRSKQQLASASCAASLAERTTLMLRNLPNNYTRDMLIDMLDSQGFHGSYDFVYLPTDFARGCGLGYAFVNLVDPCLAEKFQKSFDGYNRWAVRTSKVCQVSWSDRDHGLIKNVRRYRNSPIMHHSVPDEYKPCIFSAGLRVPFPAPTKMLRKPSKANKK